MQDKVTYEYAIVRVVPEVEREEFFNVGVILYSKQKKYLDIKYHIDEQKLRAFSTELDISYLNNYLHAWKLVCQGSAQGGPVGQLDLAYRYRWLTASRSTIIQSSMSHPGLCTDPQVVLNRLFDQYVV
jgi:hypothetical protein